MSEHFRVHGGARLYAVGPAASCGRTRLIPMASRSRTPLVARRPQVYPAHTDAATPAPSRTRFMRTSYELNGRTPVPPPERRPPAPGVLRQAHVTMRPCLSHARRLTGAALGPALLGPALLCAPSAALAPATPAALSPHAVHAPACAAPDARDFPLVARLRGGPESYESGGGYGVWYLDLVNSNGRDCAEVHPVVVLVDGQRKLKAGQVHLEYYDGEHPRAVWFEETDADELVGPFGEGDTDATAQGVGEPGEADPGDSGFAGFSVPAHRTLTVKLRLSFTSDAVTNDVTAYAAVVQRRGDDGEWVGQSDAYRFTVEGATGSPSSSTSVPPGARAEEGRELAGTGAGPVVVEVVVAGGLVAAGVGLAVVRRRRYG